MNDENTKDSIHFILTNIYFLLLLFITYLLLNYLLII